MTRGHKALAWAGGVVAVIALIILILGLLDWNMLKPSIEKIASARMDRKVTIDGNLRVHLLSWTPSATVEGIHIANPAWVPGGGDTAHIDKLSLQVRLTPLFHGKVIMPLLRVDSPDVVLLQNAQGQSNWNFGKQDQTKPLALPPIQRFEINNGHLKVDDAKRRLTFTGTVNSSEVQGGKTVQAFGLNGLGKLNGEDFTAKASGGALLNVDVSKPYPFSLDIHAGQSHVFAEGHITKPFDLGRLETRLDLSGPDLNRLYYLTGLALPNTPPYAISGRLVRDNHHFDYTGLNGHIGQSDIHGQLGVITGGPRVMVTGDLNSNKLKFEDLAAILGGAPPKSSPRSADQERIAKTLAANQRVLPDAPLQVSRLRGMDAKVKYVATAVTSETLPVRSASMNLVLDNGLLTLDPLVFGFSQGRIGGKLAINARTDIPSVNMDMRLTGASTNQFIPAKFSGAISSTLNGRARLSGSGLSVREAAAHASGQVTLVGSHGEIRDLFAQLLGVNVVKSIGLLLSKNEQKTDLRCAVADFRGKDGLLTAQTVLIDTGPTLVRGSGSINLKDEQLNLQLKGEPKKPQLLHLNAPITLKGPMVAPKLGIQTTPTIGQAGLGVAIGALVNPLAALLPFLDAGNAKDIDCPDLTAQAAPTVPAPKVAKR
jgi:uncharacterized protein involved in outer membrane biogenesis